MKTLNPTNPMKPAVNNAVADAGISTLHNLVKQLLANYQPVAVKQNSFFINDIPASFNLHADKQVLATLLGSVFYLTARCSKETCIKVSAKRYHDVLLLHIIDTNTDNTYSILSQLHHLQILAEKIGGFLDITSRRNKQTTISFSFTNQKPVQKIDEQSILKDIICKADAEFVKYLRAS